jgi:hypothetical protein
MYVGHALTSYALKPYLEGSIIEGEGVVGGWRAIIREAVEATRISMPVSCVVALNLFSLMCFCH